MVRMALRVRAAGIGLMGWRVVVLLRCHVFVVYGRLAGRLGRSIRFGGSQRALLPGYNHAVDAGMQG